MSDRDELDYLCRTFIETLRPTGTLGRSRTRRPAVGTFEAWQHLRRVIDEYRAALPATPPVSDRLQQADIERLIHVLGCPRWDVTPVEDCIYRGIHVEDAQRKGPALLAALPATPGQGDSE